MTHTQSYRDQQKRSLPMFRVGQKICCVDNQHTNSLDISEINIGSIYTVRWTDGYDVRLVEPTLRDDFGSDHPFRASRFRPIVERKTDISIFEEILRRESMPDECAPAAVYGVDWGASA